jgi:predicted lipoprotein
MKINSLVLCLGLFAVFSSSRMHAASEFEAQKSEHQSQALYLLEFNAAEQFYLKAQALEQSFQHYCLDAKSLDDVQKNWRDTATQWMSLQGQERGPLAALAQNWNIQFWPDKKNTTGLKMNALVATQNHVDREYIHQQSVAVQGIGAIEWLLFDLGSPVHLHNHAEACRVGKPIMENFANNSRRIVEAWQHNPWLNLDNQTWQSEYLSLLSNQLAFATSKLERPLANIGAPRPYFAEAWRSKYSLHLLRHNIETLRTLYHIDNGGLAGLLRAQQQDDLADRLEDQFVSLLEHWPEHDDLFDSLQTREGYRQALSLLNKLKQLDYLLNQEAAAALGVVIGFNSTDGD